MSIEVFKPAVVVPTYNNAATLRPVLQAILALRVPVFVVNDGSTDETPAVLEQWKGDAAIHVVTHERNRGKAAALRTGFAAAQELGFTHAVTVDSDGQHDPADVPRLLDAAREHPHALIVGTRDAQTENYPARSLTGRKVSNAFIRIESGLRVSDSQCGLRVYPLDLVMSLRCRADRFGFETEILTRIGWAGAEVREVPVLCRYAVRDEHQSHFRPWRDSFAAVPMHARLVGRAIIPWPHAKWKPAGHATTETSWQRLRHWFSPAHAWRELREQPGAPREMATGLAVGVFIANLPIYGLQTLLSLYTARRLHLNPLSVVAGSHISTPPVGPLLIAAAIGVGHLMLHGSWREMPAWPVSFQEWVRLSGSVFLEWTVGSLVVGLILGTGVFFVSGMLLRMVAVERD